MAECSSFDSSCELQDTTAAVNSYFQQAELSEHAIKLEERLQELRKLCHEKKVELKIIERISKDMQILKFFSKDVDKLGDFCQLVKDNDAVPELLKEQRKHVHQLLKEEEKLSNAIHEASEKTRSKEEENFKKKSLLKDYMNKRKHLWKIASEIYQQEVKKDSELEVSDTNFETSKNTSYFDEESYEYKEGISKKIQRTKELSKVLNLLVSFSGVKWAYDPDLLEIVLCTGKLLNNDLDSENLDNLSKIVDDINEQLRSVNI